MIRVTKVTNVTARPKLRRYDDISTHGSDTDGYFSFRKEDKTADDI